MIKPVIFLILIFATFSSVAQFNDSVYYQFGFSSTGIINKTGDASSYILNNGIKFNVEKKKISLSSAASWIYGEQQKSLTNNDFSIFGNVDLNKNVHPLYYWGLITYDKSYSLKINYRFQAGAGVGYTVFKNDKSNLVLSDGFLLEAGDLYRSDFGQDNYTILRNSFRVKYRFNIKDIVILEGTDFYQPSMSILKDYIVQANNSLSIPLRKWLAITAAMTYNKVSRTGRENLMFTYGITIEKFF